MLGDLCHLPILNILIVFHEIVLPFSECLIILDTNLLLQKNVWLMFFRVSNLCFKNALLVSCLLFICDIDLVLLVFVILMNLFNSKDVCLLYIVTLASRSFLTLEYHRKHKNAINLFSLILPILFT